MNLNVVNIFKNIEKQIFQSNPFEGIHNYDQSHVDQENLNQIILKETKGLDPQIKTRIENEFFSFGPIEELIYDSEISEVLINSPFSIYYEKQGEIYCHKDQFLSEQTYTNFIDRFCSENKTSLDLNKPKAYGKWKDFRFHILSPPLCEKYHCLSLRRHQSQYLCLDTLVKSNWSNEVGFECLKHIVSSKSNAIIIGTTGSGKTTVLNSLLNLLPQNERVICIEDTSEIRLPNKVSLKLLTREEVNDDKVRSFNQSDLLKESLRLRPDRIVVGEVRGHEAKDYLLALSTGHQGSLCTLHAKNAKEALWRLEMLIQMGAPDWNLRTIQGLINSGLDYVIELNSDHKNRSLKSIKKLTSKDGPNYLLEEIWPNSLSL